MMKMYEVKITKLTADMGRFDGYELIGYYTKKEPAERVAEERYAKRCKVTRGEVKIAEIEVDDED